MVNDCFVELHCHTAFSFLDGASLPTELVEQAVTLGYRALAITDHNGLHGAMEFAQAAKAAGLQPITGCELTLADGSHLTLLAETARGYANLCQMITRAYLDSSRLDPRLDPALLAQHAEGLILLTGCRQGELAQLVDQGKQAEAQAVLRRYTAWFGASSVFVELQQNLRYGDTRRMARLAQLAHECGLGTVATNNVHYHIRERHRLHDVLVAIRHRTTLDASHQLQRANSEFLLQPPPIMLRRFRHEPDAIRNTLSIAARCAQFDLTRDLPYTFPTYQTAPGETADGILARETERLLAERYGDDSKARDRLNDELRLIRKHSLAGFFLLYRDIMQLACEVAAEIRGDGARSGAALPPGRGRGSSVSSIVCFLLGLSHIDPIKNNLFLGRFLNEELASVPDIDLDFPREIRKRLIERIYEKYGSDRAALVCAFPTYHLRSAIRDVGKALGLPLPELDRLAKLSERGGAGKVETELSRLPGFQGYLQQPRWRELIELSKQIAAFPRHVSQHSGGMIISTRPLYEVVPTQPAAMPGRFLAQWDKDSVDDAHLIKIDFLALGMLSLVEECLELIADGGKPPVDLSRIDFSDPAIYEMIGKGDTIGVFQIESRAQIQTLLRTKPASLDDLTVQVAIIRPGPITGGALNPYIRQRQLLRRTGQARPTYDHPLLEPVLAETYGGILYQEQVLQVAIELAGFSAGQADAFRRAMSRKRSEAAMARFWEQFRCGAAQKGVSEATARKVFEKLLGFAAYGFPKSHAAAFAVLAYQSSYLKYYFPAEFYASLLNNQPMGFYPPHVIVNDAKRGGIRMLRPDVNRSRQRCTVENGRVRLGLQLIAGVGEEAAQTIVDIRQHGGEYRSLRDLLQRTHLSRAVLEQLILIGACDGFGLRRRELLWQLGLFLPDRRVDPSQQPTGWQRALELPTAQDMVDLPPLTVWERMATDYELLSLSPQFHPLAILRPMLPANLVRTTALGNLRHGSMIRLAGLVVCRQRPATAKGTLFLLLEDETGVVNVIVRPSLYEKRRLIARGAPFVTVTGRLQLRDNTINLIASDIHPIEQRTNRAPQPVNALLEQAEQLQDMPDDRGDEALVSRLVAPEAHNFH